LVFLLYGHTYEKGEKLKRLKGEKAKGG